MDELVDEPLRDVVDVPGTLVRRDLCVERHLQEQIPELLADRVGIADVDRVQQLVRLLQEVARERGVGLLGVPRAAAGPAEARLDADQIEDAFAALARRDRAVRDLRPRRAAGAGAGRGGHRARGYGVGEELGLWLPVAVLATWATETVCGSQRP
jgi:hypothetical protein